MPPQDRPTFFESRCYSECYTFIHVFNFQLGTDVQLVIIHITEMATNTLSAAFRKIDVDQYNEDNYREDEVADSQSPPAAPDENEITQLLNQ